MARSRWGYFWALCRRSLHGTKGVLEFGEAILATVMYVCLGLPHEKWTAS
jgi:hypothetical protein